MNIKTKYNPGDKVWTMIKNKPEYLIINTISIIVSLDFNKGIEYNIKYNCSLGSLGGNYEEKELFDRKEDLKNYLFGE